LLLTQHTGRAASRDKNLPCSIVSGRIDEMVGRREIMPEQSELPQQNEKQIVSDK
jgi:hypothetical protein